MCVFFVVVVFCFLFAFFFVVFFRFNRKNGASNVVATAQMKFASEARSSQYIVPLAIQSRLVCHYLDTLWTLRVGS